jgi:transposase
MLQEDIFASEIQKLRAENDGLGAQITRKDERLKFYESENTYLHEVIQKLKREAFGPRKERWESEEQLVFNEAEVEAKNAKPEDLVDDESEVEVDKHKRKRGKRKSIPENLPREIKLIELPESERFDEDGNPLKAIGVEKSEKLRFEPATLSVIEYHRIKYGRDTGDYVKTAPPVPSLIPKGIPDESLIASIVMQKYGYGVPLYRQEEQFKSFGVPIPRCTQARWLIEAAPSLMPIRNCLEDRLMADAYVACDETWTQVLDEKGRKPESKSWMWVRCTPGAEQKIVLFDYDPHRSGDVVKRLFLDYRGTLQVDGYCAYDVLEKREGITRIGCNMHGRRYYFDAAEGAKQGKPLANAGLRFYRALYQIEDEAKGMMAKERFELRLEKSQPIWDEFKAWADKNGPKVPPKSKIGSAFHYFQSEYTYLTGYMKDGLLEIDNGFAERMVRKFAIGRNNWLFNESVEGVEASSLYYSLIVTAKANGGDTQKKMGAVLKEAPYAKSIEDFERLADIIVARPPPPDHPDS